MAETIENNVRRVIIDESPVNPKYYDSMSELLDALIQERKREATDYKAYLQRLVELAKKVGQPAAHTSYPSGISSTPQRALYDNLGQDAELAIKLDAAIRCDEARRLAREQVQGEGGPHRDRGGPRWRKRRLRGRDLRDREGSA